MTVSLNRNHNYLSGYAIFIIVLRYNDKYGNKSFYQSDSFYPNILDSLLVPYLKVLDYREQKLNLVQYQEKTDANDAILCIV